MLIWPDHNKRTPYIGVPMVEVARLELAASWSRTKRATKLRYISVSPTFSVGLYIIFVYP